MVKRARQDSSSTEEDSESSSAAVVNAAPSPAPAAGPAAGPPIEGEKIIPLTALRWDATQTEGQTRPLNEARVERLRASVALRPPQGYVSVLVWDATGVLGFLGFSSWRLWLLAW